MDPIVEEFHEADLFEDDNGDAASSVSSEEDIALEEAQDGVGPLPNEAHGKRVRRRWGR